MAKFKENSNGKVFEDNLKLITAIAKKYKQLFPEINFNDLISEGIYGFLQGIKHFRKKKKPSKYISLWVKRYIQKYIMENFTIVKVPYHALKNIKKVFLLIDKKKDISLEEISKKLNLDVDKIKELLVERIKTTKEVSLDKYLNESEQKETLHEVIPDKSEPLESMIHYEEIKNCINKFLSKLTYEEAEVIRWRFGLKDKKHHTLKDVAEKLGLSPQKVKQIEEIALIKLKQFSKEDEDISS